MKKMAVVLTVMLLSMFMSAQDKKPMDHGTKASKPADTSGMMMTKPAAEMDKLMKAMEGTWKVTITTEPNDMNPKKSVDHGSMTVTPGPGGLSLQQNFKASFMKMPFAGHGVVWWDANGGKYQTIWCDSMAPCATGSAHWEGEDKLVTDMDAEMMGKPDKMHITGTWKGNTMTEEFQESIAGAPMKHTMTIEYARASKPAAKKPTGKE